VLGERLPHRDARLGVASLTVQCPGEQVVAVDVVPGAELLTRLGQYSFGVAHTSVIENEQPPGAVDGARLLERARRHCPRVFGGLRRVTEREVCVADRTERRWVELHGDSLIPVIDCLLPTLTRTLQPGQAAEDAIVVREDAEPSAKGCLGGIEVSGPQLELTESIVEPRDLLLR